MVLYAKFNLKEESSFRNRMIGGVFTGSSRSDFLDEDTLFIIQSKPARLNTAVKCWSDKEYRYLRYIGRPKAHCNVSEVAFYEKNDTVALTGKIIGTPEHEKRMRIMIIPMSLTGKHGLLLIIPNPPVDGRDWI